MAGETARDVIAKAMPTFEDGYSHRDHNRIAAQTADVLLSAIEQAGWMCAPKEPTEAMEDAGEDSLVGAGHNVTLEDVRRAWQAMLAAAASEGT